MKKFLSLLLVCFMLLPMFAGCNSEKGREEPTETDSESGSDTGTPEDPAGLLLAENGATEYCIVYPLIAGYSIMTAVNELMEAFSTAYHVRIKCKSDTLKKGETEDENAREILIGKTNRSATAQVSARLEENMYTACAVGTRVVLLGDTDQTTLAAVEKWIASSFSAPSANLLFAEGSEFTAAIEKKLKFSIFGDSISTYDGISNSASYNAVLENQPVYYKSDRLAAESTWWHQVIEGMKGELCVNNSYSGGRVTQDHTPKRAANLHNLAEEKPDVILIYYGINDYNNMVGRVFFAEAYDGMLKIMKQNYPDAKIYCCTLNAIKNSNTGTTLEQNGAGVTIERYNSIIKETAEKNGVEVIDLYSQIGQQLYQYTFDNIHPNEEGMKMMSDVILARLREDLAQAA